MNIYRRFTSLLALLTPLLLALSAHFDGYAGLLEKKTS